MLCIKSLALNVKEVVMVILAYLSVSLIVDMYTTLSGIFLKVVHKDAWEEG